MNKYVDDVIEILKKAIDDVLLTNQHGNVEYEFSVQCPRHQDSFLPLDDLAERDKAMCEGTNHDGITEWHRVTTSDIPSITRRKIETKVCLVCM